MITVDWQIAETIKPTKRLRWDATSPQSIIINNNGYTEAITCTRAKCPKLLKGKLLSTGDSTQESCFVQNKVRRSIKEASSWPRQLPNVPKTVFFCVRSADQTKKIRRTKKVIDDFFVSTNFNLVQADQSEID